MTNIGVMLNNWILDKTIIAYHGTSVEGLNKILQSEKFKALVFLTVVKRRLGEVLPKNGRDKFDSHIFEEDDITLIGAYSYSKCYARTRAFYDFLYYNGLSDVLKGWGEYYTEMFDFRNGPLKESAKDTLIKIGKELGHDPRKVQQKIYQGLRRRGAVVGIHRDFFLDKNLMDFDLDDSYMTYPDGIAHPEYEEQNMGIETKFIGSIYIPTLKERGELLASRKNWN